MSLKSKFLSVFLIVITAISFSNCTSAPYDKSRYLPNKLFRNIVSPYHKGDTISFVNFHNQYQTFVITRIDSALNNKKGVFINTRLNNTISLYYRQVFPLQENDDTKFITITTYPDDLSSSISFFFKNCHSVRANTLGEVLKGITNPELTFLNDSYLVNNENLDIVNPNSVIELFIKENIGIIGYKQNDSTIWKLK